MTELDHLLRRSAACRAVASILEGVAGAGCGGLTEGSLAYLFRDRHAASTVRASVRKLVLCGRVVCDGKVRMFGRTRKLWRHVRCN